jgi:hypothetical protein
MLSVTNLRILCFGLLIMLSALVPSAIMLAAIVLSSSKLSAIDLSVIILIVRYPWTSLQALLYTQHDDIQHNGTRLITLFIYNAYHNIVFYSEWCSHECYSSKCHYAKSCYAHCQYGGFRNKLLC